MLLLTSNTCESTNVGIEIQWKALNQNNLYQITLVYYRECFGLPLCSGDNCNFLNCTRSVNIYSGASSDMIHQYVGNFSLNLVSVRNSNVAERCSNANPTCTNLGCRTPGTYQRGFEKYEFTGTILLQNLQRPNDCFFSISHTLAGINAHNLDGANVVFSAMVNRCIATPSLSTGIQFHEDPLIYHPSGWGYVQNTGMYDSDKDSVSFSFISVNRSLDTPTSYITPYSPNTPMPWQGSSIAQYPNGIRCVPQNGDIMFTPPNISQDFNGFVAVQAMKRRYNLSASKFDTIGTTVRYFSNILLRDITHNSIPIFQLNQVGNYHLFNNGLYIETMATDSLLFNIQAIDANQDSTYFSSRYPIDKIGARFIKAYDSTMRNIRGPLYDSIWFSWRPDTAKISPYPYHVSLKAVDTKCPIPGSVVRNLSILVRPYYNPVITKSVTCGRIVSHFNKDHQIIKPTWQLFNQQNQLIGVSTTDTFNLIATAKGKYFIKLDIYYGIIRIIRYDTVEITSLSASNSILHYTSALLACEGESRSIKIVTHDSLLTYRWIKNGSLLQNEFTDSLFFNQINYADTGVYRTMVLSQCDTFMSTFSLVQIKPSPTITKHKNNYLYCIGDKISIPIQVSGYYPMTYIWFKNQSLSLVDTTNLLNRYAATYNDSGLYVLRASNECGHKYDSFYIGIKSSTIITQLPQSDNICPGTNTVLNVIASDDSNMTFQWRKNNFILSGETSSHLNILNMSLSNEGLYVVAVKGSCDTVFTSPVNISMVKSIAILQQPQQVTECRGKSIVIKTIANGDVGSYKWYKSFSLQDSLNQSAVFIPHFNQSDTGKYFVLLQNKCESVSSDTVQVSIKPSTDISFSINDSIQCVNNNFFVFTNTSNIQSGTFNSNWYFHDNTGSTSIVAQRIFSQVGNFPVKLITNNSFGCTDSLIKTITIGELINPFNINGPSSVLINAIIQYSAPENNQHTYSWFASNAEMLSGNNNSTVQLKFIQTGQQQLQLVVRKHNGCSLTVNKQVSVTNNTGLSNISEEISIVKIYPNPTSNSLNIELNSNTKKAVEFNIYNVVGNKVYGTQNDVHPGKNTIPIHFKLASGVYLLQVNSDASQIIKRIIIQD